MTETSRYSYCQANSQRTFTTLLVANSQPICLWNLSGSTAGQDLVNDEHPNRR